MKPIALLIPTTNRINALCATLTGLCYQEFKDFDIFISDQSDRESPFSNPTFKCIVRILSKKGHKVFLYTNLPKKGIAQNRQYLLEKSNYEYSLFLDDDLILEEYVIGGMYEAINSEKCAFVGRAPVGLSYIDDVRKNEQKIEFWTKKVQPEVISPKSKNWQRHLLHNAANILHIEENLSITKVNSKKYKIAWVGGCVLYDTKKLNEVGGFSFWKKIPQKHAGEDVFVQMLLMERYGAFGLIPSGVYHQENPTTIVDRSFNPAERKFSNL